MTTRALVFGRATMSGKISKATRNALDDLAVRGYQSATSHDAETTAEDRLRSTVRSLANANTLILLPGWEDLEPAPALGHLATQLGVEVFAYTAPGQPLETLSAESLLAPLMPGHGILAPDANLAELPHEEAARIVLGPRAAYYDSPLRNFDRIGHMWTGILLDKLRDGQRVTAEDVSLCMVGVKLSRESFRHKRDNITDAHGYLITYQMVLDERTAEESR